MLRYKPLRSEAPCKSRAEVLGDALAIGPAASGAVSNPLTISH